MRSQQIDGQQRRSVPEYNAIRVKTVDLLLYRVILNKDSPRIYRSTYLHSFLLFNNSDILFHSDRDDIKKFGFIQIPSTRTSGLKILRITNRFV